MNEAVRRLLGPVTETVYLDAHATDTRPKAQLKALLGSIRFQFALVVVLPTLLAGGYYGLIASKRYVSEAEYIVRGVTSSRVSGLNALLTSFGISRTADDTSAIQTFLQSRDAVRQLNERVDLRRIYGAAEADVLSRYPRLWQSQNFETLYETVQDYISVVQDPTKGITTLRVQAYRPDDALRVATTLLQIAEGMVNQMNSRAQADAIRNAAAEVASAEASVKDAQAALTDFRNRELLVDPNSFSTILLQLIGKLSVDLAQTTATIKETLRTSAASPMIASLQAKAETLDERIKAEREKLGGDKNALADKMAGYEHMTLLRDMAAKRYGAALTSLEDARQEARRQQIYIEEMVRPGLPDDATEPKRWRSTLTVFVLCFAAFSMLWILTVGAKDHAQ